MLEELERLIKFIEQEYFEFNKQWKESTYYYEINLRKKTINDLIDDNILNAIFNYREFINEKNTKLIIDFMHFNTTKAKVNVRTKTRNSIEYKKENYIANHNNGEIPINKCFNDLFGIRIICMEELSKEQVLLLLNEKFKNLKCIDSSKEEYKAIHIYFRENNFSFPWELQIWNKCDEMSNIISHEKYKQDYVKWERKNKGGSK